MPEIRDESIKELDVTINLPAYNEEEAIAIVIDDVRSVMDKTDYTYEILVVDDASTDKTCEIAKSKKVRVKEHKLNRGSGASRRTGVVHARGKIIVVLDADGTYETEAIPRLLEHFPEYDQVNGWRTSEEGTTKLLRVPAKYLIRKLACYLSNTNIPDLNTGLKAFKRDIMLRYLWVIPNGFSCVTTMTLAFLCNGYNVKWIKTKYHSRIGASKFHPIKDTRQYIITVIRMTLYFNPLSVFMPLGTLLIAFGAFRWIQFRLFDIGGKLFYGPILVQLGFVLYALGLIADLIVAQSKIYRDHSLTS